jgi:TPR repeat protein
MRARAADEYLLGLDSGVDDIAKCVKARELYVKATGEELTIGIPEFGDPILKKGWTCMILSNNLVDVEENYRDAIELFRKARINGLVDGSIRYAESLDSEAAAHNALACSENPESHYLAAAALYEEARSHGFANGSHEYASMMVEEAVARLQLSRLNVDSEQNQVAVGRLIERARSSGLRLKTFHEMVATDLSEKHREEDA